MIPGQQGKGTEVVEVAVGQENQVDGERAQALQAGQGSGPDLLRMNARIDDNVHRIQLQ